MAISHTLTLSWARNGESISQTVTIENEAENNRDVTVAQNVTDQLVNLNIDVSELKLLYLHCDKAIQIQTNDGSSPDNTLTLAANKPLVWYTGCGLTNPLTVDVTKFYLTTGAVGTDATLKIRTVQDSSP